MCSAGSTFALFYIFTFLTLHDYMLFDKFHRIKCCPRWKQRGEIIYINVFVWFGFFFRPSFKLYFRKVSLINIKNLKKKSTSPANISYSWKSQDLCEKQAD